MIVRNKNNYKLFVNLDVFLRIVMLMTYGNWIGSE